MNHIRSVTAFLLFAALSLTSTNAQVFNERYSDWPEQHRINGRILVNIGLEDLGQVESLLKRFAAKKNVVCFKPL